MNEFRQHFPSSCDFDNPKEIKFSTTEELLNLDAVSSWKEKNKFSHFAISNNSLMAIFDEGYRWWVIGYIKYPENVDLPKWEGEGKLWK